MTVSTTITSNKFNTNGVTQSFTFLFYVTSVDQVKASISDGDSETPYTNFTVTLDNEGEGGELVTGDILSGVELMIYRDTPLTQETDYIEGGRFPAESHEEALDKLTLQNQEQQSEIDRTLKYGEFSGVYNAGGRRVENVADGVKDTDGINKLQSQNLTVDIINNIGVGGGSIISEEPPASPIDGQRWTRCSDMLSFIWYVDDDGGQWVEDNPSVGGTSFLSLPEYADDAAAGAGGLTANALYKTPTGEVRIKL